MFINLSLTYSVSFSYKYRPQVIVALAPYETLSARKITNIFISYYGCCSHPKIFMLITSLKLN